MSTILVTDARNRAVRTFVQGLAIDIAVAACALILTSLDTITSKAGLITFGLSLARTVVSTGAAYVMRRFADGSIPTPLPPAVAGPPAEPVVL